MQHIYRKELYAIFIIIEDLGELYRCLRKGIYTKYRRFFDLLGDVFLYINY